MLHSKTVYLRSRFSVSNRSKVLKKFLLQLGQRSQRSNRFRFHKADFKVRPERFG